MIYHLVKICDTALINEEVKIGTKKLETEKDDSELECYYQIANQEEMALEFQWALALCRLTKEGEFQLHDFKNHNHPLISFVSYETP